MKAVIVRDKSLVIGGVPAPQPKRNEALVAVRAISLNRGEVQLSMGARDGFRPGWDLAGVVETAAADGSGPPAGARVVGLLPSSRASAEQAAVPADFLAALPDQVSFETAATLPVAGLTALYALSKGGDLLERKVLVTGATGGVGQFGCTLAKLAGARVVGVARDERHTALVRHAGADAVAVIGDDPMRAAAHGPYDLILESVGGASLAASMGMLAERGLCVLVGVSGGSDVTFDAAYQIFSVNLLSYPSCEQTPSGNIAHQVYATYVSGVYFGGDVGTQDALVIDETEGNLDQFGQFYPDHIERYYYVIDVGRYLLIPVG